MQGHPVTTEQRDLCTHTHTPLPPYTQENNGKVLAWMIPIQVTRLLLPSKNPLHVESLSRRVLPILPPYMLFFYVQGGVLSFFVGMQPPPLTHTHLPPAILFRESLTTQFYKRTLVPPRNLSASPLPHSTPTSTFSLSSSLNACLASSLLLQALPVLRSSSSLCPGSQLTQGDQKKKRKTTGVARCRLQGCENPVMSSILSHRKMHFAKPHQSRMHLLGCLHTPPLGPQG